MKEEHLTDSYRLPSWTYDYIANKSIDISFGANQSARTRIRPMPLAPSVCVLSSVSTYAKAKTELAPHLFVPFNSDKQQVSYFWIDTVICCTISVFCMRRAATGCSVVYKHVVFGRNKLNQRWAGAPMSCIRCWRPPISTGFASRKRAIPLSTSESVYWPGGGNSIGIHIVEMDTITFIQSTTTNGSGNPYEFEQQRRSCTVRGCVLYCVLGFWLPPFFSQKQAIHSADAATNIEKEVGLSQSRNISGPTRTKDVDDS